MKIVSSGLCFLPFCLPRFYVLVQQDRSWDEARSFCRSTYTDLAAVQSDAELSELRRVTDHELFVWLGLRPDATWRWSLENLDFYSTGQAGFRRWASGRPGAGLSFSRVCVEMWSSGEWTDDACDSPKPFVCCSGGTAQNQEPDFVLVTRAMSWTDAQSYCRLHHTDLASVRNQAENDQVLVTAQNQRVWIGLYTDSWAWSDGSPYSFSSWGSGPTQSSAADACLNSHYGQWTIRSCSAMSFFACYAVPVRKRLLQVVLKEAGSSVGMKELKDDILQKLSDTVNVRSLQEDVRLSWVERPGAQVFSRRTAGTRPEETCPSQQE